MATRYSYPLPPVWRFNFGDYVGLGPIFQRFLGMLNSFNQDIFNLMNGGIGFSNMQRSVYKTSIVGSANVSLSFVNPLNIPPTGLALIQIAEAANPLAPISSSVSVANWYFDGQQINILSIPGLTSGIKYNLTLEVM